MGSEEELPERPIGSAQLRALAHPLRLQLLQALQAEGPATASQLGRLLGQSSGATSYHLRALHRAGMVMEAEQRNGRERWWQRIPERVQLPTFIASDATDAERKGLQAAHAQVESFLVEDDEKALLRWYEIRYGLPLEWQQSQWIGGFRIYATRQQVAEFGEAVLDLAEPLRQPPEDDDSERLELHFTFRVLPQQQPGS